MPGCRVGSRDGFLFCATTLLNQKHMQIWGSSGSFYHMRRPVNEFDELPCGKGMHEKTLEAKMRYHRRAYTVTSGLGVRPSPTWWVWQIFTQENNSISDNNCTTWQLDSDAENNF